MLAVEAIMVIAVRGSGSQYVYDELRQRILSLDLKPGSRVVEESLASALGVSRTPLREAIRQLVSENLLERQPTGGVVVPLLDTKEIAELYEVRAALEGLMASEAAVRVEASDIPHLEGIVARNAALVDFPEDAMRFGKALHTALAEIAGNSWATRLHGQVGSQMERYRRFTNNSESRRHLALEQHREIVRLVAAGEAEKAGALAYRHVLDARDEAVRAASAGLDG